MPSSPAHLTKGRGVRILHPPVEGRLEIGFEGLDVGRRFRVQLIRTDVERGSLRYCSGYRTRFVRWIWTEERASVTLPARRLTLDQTLAELL